MENNSKDYFEIDIFKVIQFLLHRLWIIIIAGAVGCAALIVYAAFFVSPQYQAQAMMYVNNSGLSIGGSKISISTAEISAGRTLVDTYIVILNSRLTLNEVIKEAGLPYSYSQLKKMLSASSVNDTEVFSITVTDKDPEEAALIANTIVDVLPDKIADIVDGSSVRTVDYAVVPTSKTSPSITKYAAIGLVAGVVLACGVLFIIFIQDTVIHDEDYLIDTYDLPILAVIPNLTDSSGNGYYSAYETKSKSGAKKS